jgi:hypothetical protein
MLINAIIAKEIIEFELVVTYCADTPITDEAL